MKERIAIDPRIHFGKPCVAGTRIPVQNVLELVREGLSFSVITGEYFPDLQSEDIRACIQYAIDVLAVEDIHLARRMKFLADQDVYAATVVFLRNLGHDVVAVAQLGLAQAADAELLRIAHEQGRIFVTHNRDFGGLVFVQDAGAGVIYLRVLPSTLNVVHTELARILTLYTEQDLQGSFVVVEAGRHRIRRLTAGP